MHKIRLASILINLCVLFLAPTSLSIAESKSITTTPIDALGSLFSGFNNSPSNELLEPDDAFNFFAEVNNDQQLVLNWRIAKGYYLYQEKIAATVFNGLEADRIDVRDLR